MERLTEENREYSEYDIDMDAENCARFANKLAEFEDREEFLEKQVYFILNDSLAEDKIKGDYYVSAPHSVIDVSTMGFWTGGPSDFPFNADFTRWDEEYFTSYQTAKKAIERMVE